MQRSHMLVTPCVISILAFCCNDLDQVVTDPPAVIDWEGNAPLYNEAYRDTIITLAGGGVTLIHKDGSVGRILGEGIGASSATWSPRKWKILYVTGDKIFGYHMYLMDANGTGSRLLTSARERYLYAVMAPDGQKIAYLAIDSTDTYHMRGVVRVINPDGTGIRSLTPTLVLGPTSVSCTSDSRQVIYSDQDSSEGRINIVSIDGSGGQTLYRCKGSACDNPSLSPDGSSIAFTTSLGPLAAAKIVVFDMRTFVCAQLTPGSTLDYYPSWSTDGKQLVYISTTGESAPQLLWRIDADGQNSICITNSYSMSFRRPDW